MSNVIETDSPSAVASPYRVSAAEVVARLKSDAANGLSEAEAARRLGEYGPNQLQAKPPVPGWKKFLAQFKDPLVLLLIVATVISLIAWALEGFPGFPFEAFVIMAIVVLNAVIGYIQESRAEEAVAALQKMTSAHATVIRGGKQLSVPSAELVPEDILLIEEGNAITADGRLLEVTSLQMAEAALTGESQPVTKDLEAINEEAPLGDWTNMVFSGTACTFGRGRAISALPLMQFALKDLFDAQQARGGIIALTLNDYLQRGGIHKALERHADYSFSKLDSHEQELARSIFSGLIEIGRGTQNTRRTAFFDELVPASANIEEVGAVVRKLADARLITTDEIGGRETVTISQEKLIDAWPWLKKLVNENRDVIALQNEIAADAKEWDEHKRDSSYLYPGTRLEEVQEWTNKSPNLLSPLAIKFVKRRERLRWIALAGVGVLLLLVAVLGVSGQLNGFIYRPVDVEAYWVTIPAGEFQMGSEIGRDDEKPVHTVYLDAYQIGKYEVTNKQYNQCLRAGVCTGSGVPDKLDHPVVNINWYAAKTYCEWAGVCRPKPNGKKPRVVWMNIPILGVRRLIVRMQITPDITVASVTQPLLAVMKAGKVPMAYVTWRVMFGNG